MIHVLIERNIAQGMLSTYYAHCRAGLNQSYQSEGFIDGEVYYDTQDENHQFVLCKWRTLQDWENWYTSTERREIMNLINPVLTQPETITTLKN